MKPQKGQYVKIIFNNATQAEGFVEEWSDNTSVLKAEDNSSYLVINKTFEDIMAIKIMITHIPTTQNKQKFEKLVEEFQETYERPSGNDLRLKRLGHLRGMMAEQEKKIVAEKMVEHIPSNVQGVKYGNPFITKPHTK